MGYAFHRLRTNSDTDFLGFLLKATETIDVTGKSDILARKLLASVYHLVRHKTGGTASGTSEHHR